MNAPMASIVIPTRGGALRLPRLFDSLRAQTQHDFEAIVVVDGDVDGSENVVAAAAADLPVRAVVFPENRGRSAALNAGFEKSRGHILIRCDDDLLPGPNYVAGHVARHMGEPCGVVGLPRNVYRPSPYARAYGRTRDVRFREDAYRAPAHDRWRFWAGNVSVTRDTFTMVGPYDTAFRAYGWEDIDWGYRLSLSGLPILLASELETVHTGAAPTTAIRVDKAFHSGAARQRFVAKHGSSVVATPGRRSGLWARLIAVTARLLGRRPLVALAGVADVVIDIPPRWLSEKLVAWLVESAALSGQRRHRDVTTAV